MPKYQKIVSVVRVLYRELIPASVRKPLYQLRHRVLGSLNYELQPYPYEIPQAIPHSDSEPNGNRYRLNAEGIPTASASIVPAVDSRPQPGIPERMMVGNPQREQLYL